jgi:hypothetical protein
MKRLRPQWNGSHHLLSEELKDDWGQSLLTNQTADIFDDHAPGTIAEEKTSTRTVNAIMTEDPNPTPFTPINLLGKKHVLPEVTPLANSNTFSVQSASLEQDVLNNIGAREEYISQLKRIVNKVKLNNGLSNTDPNSSDKLNITAELLKKVSDLLLLLRSSAVKTVESIVSWRATARWR